MQTGSRMCYNKASLNRQRVGQWLRRSEDADTYDKRRRRKSRKLNKKKERKKKVDQTDEQTKRRRN